MEQLQCLIIKRKHFISVVFVCVKLLHLVSQRQRAVDVQTVVALQLQQRVSQKFLWGQEAETEMEWWDDVD